MPRIRRPRTLLLVIVASVPGAVGHSRGGGGALIYPRRRTAPEHYGGARWPSRSDASAATARDREVSVRCRRANPRADSPPQAGPHRVSARPVLRATQPLPRGCGPPLLPTQG